jgi:hypothetical protein
MNYTSSPVLRRSRFVGLALLATSLPALASAAVLLNDTFSDGERATQTLANSAQWFASSAATNLTVASGALSLTTGASGTHALAYFTSSGSPVTLGIGESLSLTFDITLAGPTSVVGGLRIGLFNSGGTRISADGGGASNTAYTDDSGYMATVAPVGSATSPFNNTLRVYDGRLTTGSTALLASTSNPPYATVLLSGNVANKNFNAANVYNAIYTLSRTSATEMSISLSYTGIFSSDLSASTISITTVDNASIATSFDTVAFYSHSGATSALTLDNVVVSYVPEPSATAALTAACALGFVAARRRRRASATC